MSGKQESHKLEEGRLLKDKLRFLKDTLNDLKEEGTK
jgi:hypothetical protein